MKGGDLSAQKEGRLVEQVAAGSCCPCLDLVKAVIGFRKSGFPEGSTVAAPQMLEETGKGNRCNLSSLKAQLILIGHCFGPCALGHGTSVAKAGKGERQVNVW